MEENTDKAQGEEKAQSEPKVSVFRSTYRLLTNDESDLISRIKDKADELYELIESSIQENPSPKVREIAVAKTKLEESIMWAVKGITK